MNIHSISLEDNPVRYWLLELSILLCSVTAGFASQELILPWSSEIRIESAGTADSGQILLTATVSSSDEWKKLELSAFGKTFILDEKQLAALNGYPTSSLVTTYEPGYEELGGHTVHWRFKRLYREGDRSIEREIIISISKGKGLQIRE